MLRARRDKEREQIAFGAAHRENVDTPPLGRNCGDTSRISSVTNSDGDAFSNPVLVLGVEPLGERVTHALHIQ